MRLILLVLLCQPLLLPIGPVLLHPTPYIYSLLLPTAVGHRSKVGIPRGRCENHVFVSIAFIVVLEFDFFISLCFTVNNRRRGALA